MGLTNKQLILAKVETTYGTDASPTNALNAIKCGNLNITPLDVETVERNIVQPFFGANQKIIVSKKVSIDFEVELAGSGTAGTAPHYGVLMKACAFAETVAAGISVTYNPITLSSVTQAGTSVSILFSARWY